MWMCNNQVQSTGFGGSSVKKVPIEGYNCESCVYGSCYALKLDFHLFLSDCTVQEARTVYYHLKQLIIELRKQGKLKPGQRLLCITDGCVKQYCLATSLYFMSMLASSFDIVIDRGVCLVGHGKSLVDAINALSKNVMLRVSYRRVKEAKAAAGDDKISFNVYVFEKGKGRVSPVEDCKEILEKHQSIDKRKRRKKKDQHIDKMIYCVRKVNQKLNKSKYNTIEFPEKGVKFSDMYHFYSCKLLGVGHVACCCVPCYCPVCNEMIQKE